MNTGFQFCSTAFNTSVPRDHFINPNCFGDDLAEWMIGELRARGVKTDEKPGQEDFGWYFGFEAGGVEHCVVLGFQPNDIERGDCWIGWLERNVGFLGSLIGGRNRNISPEAISLIDDVLRSSDEIHDLKWQRPDDL